MLKTSYAPYGAVFNVAQPNSICWNNDVLKGSYRDQARTASEWLKRLKQEVLSPCLLLEYFHDKYGGDIAGDSMIDTFEAKSIVYI